jgi:hypothetical protein
VTPAAAALVTFCADDDAGDRRVDIDDAGGDGLVLTPRVSSCCFGRGEVGLRVGFSGILRLLERGQRNRAVIVEVFGAVEGLMGKLLVVGGLEVSVERVGDIGALHLEKQLALLHVVIERARISTTRPLAREMTGTSREMSGFTEPVTLSSSGNSQILWAATRGNCSG